VRTAETGGREALERLRKKYRRYPTNRTPKVGSKREMLARFRNGGEKTEAEKRGEACRSKGKVKEGWKGQKQRLRAIGITRGSSLEVERRGKDSTVMGSLISLQTKSGGDMA